MKRTFGIPLSRWLGGGAQLSAAEHAVLSALVEALPANVKSVVDAQFNAYNLVQREIDGRALNFYCRGGAPASFPLLELKTAECPLVKLAVEFDSATEPMHAALVAVNGRAFCLSLSENISQREHVQNMRIANVVQSWRSNL